jgi:MoxR-like ATPase
MPIKMVAPRKSINDEAISFALYARRSSPLEFYPWLNPSFKPRTGAVRNTGDVGVSLMLTKALLVALCGRVTHLIDTETAILVESSSTTRTTKSGKPSGELAALIKPTPTATPSQVVPLNAQFLFGTTYHVGLLTLAEVVVRADEATDAMQAWIDLVEYVQEKHKLPLVWEELVHLNDVELNHLLVRAGDELYFWLRYQNAPVVNCIADGLYDRLANQVKVDKRVPTERVRTGMSDLANVMLDVANLRTRLGGRTPSAPVATPSAPVVVPSASAKGFKGPQKRILARSVEQRVSTLLFGQTATGKTECVNEVITDLGWGYEHVAGKEGLADLDLFGGLTKTKDGLAWVDGPIARAMRRAATEPIIVFIDEFTRIRQEQVNILIDLLNEVPEALMLKSGVTLWGTSKRGMYRRVEVPQCDGVFNCPAENLVVIAACNLGRAYSVQSIEPALMRRLKRKIEFRYLKADDEVALLVEKSPVTLDRKVAQACVGVANQVRAMSATGEVSAPLDTGSLIYWTSEIAVRWKSLGASARVRSTAITIAQEEASTIWIPAVLAPDLNGQMPDAKVASMNDIIRDQFTANL